MKKSFILLFCLISTVILSQKKALKKIETLANDINIYTAGLDNIILENSNSDFVEVYLYAESYDEQLILIENKPKELDIKFHFEGTETREIIFRKFITKRLQRATAIVKVPKNKKLFIFGETIDIESENIKNELAIYIENGIVKLNTLNANTTLQLYSGNVYAEVNNAKISLTSNKGKINIDNVLHKKSFKNNKINFDKELTISTITANIFLTNQ